jgi:hypothetical protein
MDNCVNGFVGTVQSIIDCTRVEAMGILTLYIKEKLVKRDMANGTYRVKHGMFLDAETLHNAQQAITTR